MKHLYRFKLHQLISVLVIILFIGCSQPEKVTTDTTTTLFEKVANNHSNIHFSNTVTEDLYFNFLNYPYIYNGGGVSVGDINNDGLEDLYFTSNQHSNVLYLNQGNLKFKDITVDANVTDDKGWSTGTTMVDINNDGWLDIYISKSGSLNNNDLRKNKLFINQQNNTFVESAAAYGIDFYGFFIVRREGVHTGRHINRLRALLPKGTYENIYIYLSASSDCCRPQHWAQIWEKTNQDSDIGRRRYYH